MGAGAETLMEKLEQDKLISLKFICAKGLVDIYQHPDTKSYYAKVNEVLLHNGYAENNFKVSRLQKGKLKYPTVCVSLDTNPESHLRPTVYIELTQPSLESLASVYKGIDLEHSLSLVPSKSPDDIKIINSFNDVHYCVDDNKVHYKVDKNNEAHYKTGTSTDNINLKNIIKSFEEAVSELSIENNNLKNELEKERERYKENLIDIAERLGSFVKTCEDLIKISEPLYDDLLILIKEESNSDNKEYKRGDNDGNQEE